MSLPTSRSTRGSLSVKTVGACALACSSSTAQAAAPVLFDIQGLLLTLLVWYGVAIALGFGVARVKAGMMKSLAALGLFTYVLAPPVAFVVSEKVKRESNEKNEQRFQEALKDDALALADYCKARVQRVNKVVSDGTDDVVAIRIDKGFTGPPPHFGGWSVAEALRKDPLSCTRLRVKFIEEAFPPDSIASGGQPSEYRRYSICEKSGFQAIASVGARYELVLGATSERKPYPNTKLSDTWMSFSSVQIVDRKSGTVLAEDALYFDRYEPSGVASCPSGLPVIKELLEKVFGT
jgi:hypothetical protein